MSMYPTFRADAFWTAYRLALFQFLGPHRLGFWFVRLKKVKKCHISTTLFISFSSYKLDTQITRILTLYQANVPNLTRCNFLKHMPKVIIYLAHIICRHLSIIHSSMNYC